LCARDFSAAYAHAGKPFVLSKADPLPTHIPTQKQLHTHIRADGISRSYGDHRIISDLTLIIDSTHRVGLIGENGAGKSTLLRLLAGTELPDRGTVTRPARTALLWQEVQYAPTDTVEQLIEDALSDIRAIERDLVDAAAALAEAGEAGEAGEAPAPATDGAPPAGSATHAAPEVDPAERYSQALAAAEAADVWTVEARRDEILAGLGVAGIPLTRRLEEVSGGQRSRFALAALLLARPSALLLDEPTNHLDDSATEFLRTQLIAWPGPVVFASHDRAFLDEVATVLVDLDPSRAGAATGGASDDGGTTGSGGGATGRRSGPTSIRRSAPTRFGGTYTEYLAEKAAERRRWETQYAVEQQELRYLDNSVAVTAREIENDKPRPDHDKMGFDFRTGKVQKQVSRRIRNAQGRLTELQDTQVAPPAAVLAFTGIPHGSHALDYESALLKLRGTHVAGRLHITKLAIEATSSILVTGANGAGKSTLLGVLAGTVRADGGSVHRRRGLRVALLEQDVRFTDPTRSPRSIYERTVGERRAELVPLAGLGLLASRDLDRPTGTLSIGQQRRLALALIIARPPHVFLLDEPTNHLSLDLATELEDALGTYPGAVIVASHDRWLRRRWEGATLPLRDGVVIGEGDGADAPDQQDTMPDATEIADNASVQLVDSRGV
jgi:macrolide transport system ATP-binding/permease protein